MITVEDLLSMWHHGSPFAPSETTPDMWHTNSDPPSSACFITVQVKGQQGAFTCSLIVGWSPEVVGFGATKEQAVFAALQQHAYLAGAAYARKKDAAKARSDRALKAKAHAAIIHQRAERFRKK
jgi:hypothetical protein